MALIDFQREMWERMAARISSVEVRLEGLTGISARAEVAGATARYANAAALPTGSLGMIATIRDDGGGNTAFMWHDGAAWQQVYP